MVILKDGFGNVYEPEVFKFPGGEVQVRIPEKLFKPILEQNKAVIYCVIRSSDDIMAIFMFNDAIKSINPTTSVDLVIPYMPYARQDRACVMGEALSVRVMAQLINSCGFNKVVIHDPHSDVAAALINNVCVIDQEYLFRRVCRKGALGYYSEKAEIVSPDAGAEKKAMKIAKAIQKDKIIRAGKVRDVATGEITETVIYDDVPEFVLIVDDICDGGRTFIELAKKLKEKGAKTVGLYVTHGIFSKGKDVLREHIDDIFAYYDWTEGNNAAN